VRHERPECSGPGPGSWQGNAANIPETQSEPAYSTAFSLMLGGVYTVILALAVAPLGFVAFKLLSADAALRAFAQWTVLGFLFVYCVLSYRAVKRVN